MPRLSNLSSKRRRRRTTKVREGRQAPAVDDEDTPGTSRMVESAHEEGQPAENQSTVDESESIIYKLPEEIWAHIGSYLVRRTSIQDIARLGATCRFLNGAANRTMEKMASTLALQDLIYQDCYRVFQDPSRRRGTTMPTYAFQLRPSVKLAKYQKFDSIRHLLREDSVVADRSQKMYIDRLQFSDDDRALIAKVIPSIETLEAYVESAEAIETIVGLIGNADVDTFHMRASYFDEEIKEAVLAFYQQRKGKLLYIETDFLNQIINFEESVGRLVEKVDVTIRLRFYIGGISKPRWYELLRSVVANGGQASIDGVEWPDATMENRTPLRMAGTFLVQLSLPNREAS